MSEDARGPEPPAAGEVAGLGELFRRHRGDVGRLCRRLLGPDAAVEDATSEVFLRAQRALPSYDTARPFRPWLLAIAGHHCIDRLRRGRTEARLFAEEAPDESELASSTLSPLARLLREEERAALLSAIETLPDRYRVPLVLRYFGDLDYEAIAEALEVSRGQVGVLLFRARRRLREALSDSSDRGVTS